jgi:hypothetical protein
MSDQASSSASPHDRVADDGRDCQAIRDPAAISRTRRIVLLRPTADRTQRFADGERRATRRALGDWQRLRASGLLPTLQDLSPFLDSVDWEDRFLLACDQDPARSVFVLCGSRVEAAFGQRMIGRVLCDVAGGKAALIRACANAVKELRPAEVEDAVDVAEGHISIYRAVFMPVRGADSDCRYLMGAYGCYAMRG